MNKQNKYIAIGLVIILIAVSFYSGVSYGKKSTANDSAPRFGPGGRGGRIGGPGNGALSGTVAAKDGESITVQTRDGSSRFAFMSTSTPVSKSVTGSADDLTIGTPVMVIGTTNQDGSIAAQSIQIRSQTP